MKKSLLYEVLLSFTVALINLRADAVASGLVSRYSELYNALAGLSFYCRSVLKCMDDEK